MKKIKERILNIGCGTETYGTDFVDIYPSRKGVIKCDVSAEKLPYKNETFDEVYSRFLLEHIPSPMKIIGEMKRVLKRGGKLVIFTDNAGFLMFHLPIRKNNFLQHYSNAVRGGDKDRHYFLFTPLHLENLIRVGGGFKEAKVNYLYVSNRKVIIFLKPFLHFLSKSFLRRIINPTLIVEAYKK